MDKREQIARTKIISASRSLFLEYGYAGVSTAMLAKEASTSKATLYKYFKDMNHVLGEVLKEEEMRIEQGVEMEFDTIDTFLINLVKYGTNLLHFLNDPDIAKFDAILAEHGKYSPELAEHYYLASYGSSVSLVKTMLERANSLNLLDLPLESEDYAEMFLSALEGFGFVKARFGVISNPYHKPKSRVESVVALLIKPYLK
ncbi:MAG: TetR/AcrR family transcriptional regulator [Pseudomonadota bacterium]